jgi:hypothetical protein
MRSAYQITTEQEDIVIRLPRQFADEKELTKLLDYLELEAIRRKSELSAEEATALSEGVKQGAWEQIKHLFRQEG